MSTVQYEPVENMEASKVMKKKGNQRARKILLVSLAAILAALIHLNTGKYQIHFWRRLKKRFANPCNAP